MKNYYKILEVTRNASTDEIRKKFKELALEYHPDVSKHENAHDIFIEINEAYHILINDNERYLYNQLYDKYVLRLSPDINNEQKTRNDFDEIIRKAKEKAHNDAKVKYAEYIKNLNCYYNPKFKADGSPYIFYVHKVLYIKGTGPSGSIKAKMKKILIPRSKKAAKLHNIGLTIKLIFLLIAGIPHFIYLPDIRLIIKFFVTLIILLMGGLITWGFYRLHQTKSKYYYSRKYYLCQKDLKNGYSVGFHPFISNTPFGLIYHLLRILL